MSNLAATQRAMQAAVMGRAANTGIAAGIVGNAEAGAAERIGIYAHAYRSRLTEILAEDYPALAAVAGEDGFGAIASAYIDAIPSRHRNVRWYGDALAGFLRSSQGWSAKPELADLAALDWAIGLAFDAADEPSRPASDLAAMAPSQWPGLRLRPHPSLQFVPLATNAGAIRRAVDDGDPPPPTMVLAPPETRAAWRHDGTVLHRGLADDEAAAVEALASGTFADLCSALRPFHEEGAVAPRAAALLRCWFDDHWIAAIAPGGTAITPPA